MPSNLQMLSRFRNIFKPGFRVYSMYAVTEHTRSSKRICVEGTRWHNSVFYIIRNSCRCKHTFLLKLTKVLRPNVYKTILTIIWWIKSSLNKCRKNNGEKNIDITNITVLQPYYCPSHLVWKRVSAFPDTLISKTFL